MKQYQLQKLSPPSEITREQFDLGLDGLDLGPLATDEEPIQLVVQLVVEKPETPAVLKARYVANVWVSAEELDEVIAKGEQPVVLSVRDV